MICFTEPKDSFRWVPIVIENSRSYSFEFEPLTIDSLKQNINKYIRNKEMYNKNDKKRTQKNMNKIARNLQDLYVFYGKLRLNYINKDEIFILIYTEQKNERIYRHEEMNGLRKTTLKN